jgi:hypothetical protein
MYICYIKSLMYLTILAQSSFLCADAPLSNHSFIHSLSLLAVNRMTVRRDHVLDDAFGKVMSISKKDLQKSKLFIAFQGEEG